MRITTSILVFAALAAFGCNPELSEEDLSDQDLDLSEGAEGTIVWQLGERFEEIAYRVDSGLVMTGGDMVLGSVEDVRERLTVSFANHHGGRGWPGNEIPYFIDPGVSEELEGRILEAIDWWNRRSIFKLRERVGSEYYLRFRQNVAHSNPRCRAEVGYQGHVPFRTFQSIWLDDTLEDRCSRSSATHEIGHALGLYHEHQRSDRDLFVNVIYDNIVEERYSDFNQTGVAFGPYNHNSLMHYGNRTAGKSFVQVDSSGDETEMNRMTIVKLGETPACPNNDDSRPECDVGRLSANTFGRYIITDLDLAGAVRANHGPMNSAFRLRNSQTQRCMGGATTNGHVLANANPSMSSSCSVTSSRRWYQSTDANSNKKVLINHSGRVCLTRHTSRAGAYLKLRECGRGVTQEAFLSPLGNSRYRIMLRNGDCLTDLGRSSAVSRACDGDADQVWEKF